MQNDLKYGKICELCGINGYFAEKRREKIASAASKISPAGCGERKFTHIFIGGGGESTFSTNILLCTYYIRVHQCTIHVKSAHRRR